VLSVSANLAERMTKMSKKKAEVLSEKREPPALSPEEREKQLIALAVNLAEKKLRDGTASNQIIVHYLKLGSTREALEKEILEKQVNLVSAKTEALQSAQEVKELYEQAIDAIRVYSGNGSRDEYEDV
jgi:EAL domain-containing protein (putative c-di-GMP-specific phosphodiesterase class I)